MTTILYNKIITLSIFTILITSIAPAQEGVLSIKEDPRISEMLKIQKELEKENRLTIAYTIQLYYGELKEANEVLKKYQRSYTNWPASIEYETPNYKVWAGNFSSRIEAERALKLIKRDFSSAFILQPDRK